ncbi:pyrimidine dimer DNA glycosylase/endonuclease V [Comamonas sp. NoAH]|uniref:pyrimidine dimer DNA glycosylase/endonuclease V n=1 Tax=Comamonas halotolerans TaxID=3041496 RepID=UPI0024E12A6B|nr:pyrimidine dimer DNA glycosylase/endonuclease V [Comamonas sp. NoAH]
MRVMRIWSLHPRYLDPQGLVALWRETLLAQAVLHGHTKGYTNHPQLQRFKSHAQPRVAIASYLHAVHAQAIQRGYKFDASKILEASQATPIAVTTGQLDYEWQHLMNKLHKRNPMLHAQWHEVQQPEVHPLFVLVPGEVSDWEIR